MFARSSRLRLVLQVILIAVVAIGLYGILPQFANFQASLQAIRSASTGYSALAIIAIATSYGLAATTYCLLSVSKLRFGRTLLIELAGLFVNRIVPAGIGGLGLNFAYLRANKHTVGQASSVVTLNNVIGLVGHALLAIVIVGTHPTELQGHHFPALPIRDAYLAAGFMALLLSLLLIVYRLRRARVQTVLKKFMVQLHQVLAHYRSRRKRVLWAVIASCMLTLANVTCLWLCCYALHISLNFLTVFLIFTLGVAVGTVTPTPGGLGGTEAALVTGLVASHIPAAISLAIVLLYRLITFWLALGVGLVALFFVRSQHLVSLKTV